MRIEVHENETHMKNGIGRIEEIKRTAREECVGLSIKQQHKMQGGKDEGMWCLDDHFTLKVAMYSEQPATPSQVSGSGPAVYESST